MMIRVILLNSIVIITIITTWFFNPWLSFSTAQESPLGPHAQGLYFHNNTQADIWVAIAHPNPVSGDGWVSQGWLHLKPGETRQGYVGYLHNQYYAYYAKTANEQQRWQGDRQFGVHAGNWQYLLQRDSTTLSYQARPFRLIDIGTPHRAAYLVHISVE